MPSNTIKPQGDRRELGASLKRVGEAFIRLGNAEGWSPTVDSAALRTWERASGVSNPLERTLLEADVTAALLTRSAADHTIAVGDAISTTRPLLPFTIGRTAVEHALRAVHLLDGDTTPQDRAERRLNEWAYAVEEAERLRQGVLMHAPEGVGPLADHEGQRQAIRDRARSLDLAVSDGKELRVGGVRRMSTMAIGEKYLAGEDGAGVVSVLLRQHAAADHGVETSLVSAVEDFAGPAGVNIMRFVAAPVPRLAFGLLAVPLSVVRAMQELRRHYEWATTSPHAQQLDKEQARTLDLWKARVNQFEDEISDGSTSADS